jgi:hypothetical protein
MMSEQALKRTSRFTEILMWVVVLFGLAVIFVIAYGRQLAYVVLTNYAAMQKPFMRSTPAALPDTSVTKLPIDAHGCPCATTRGYDQIYSNFPGRI